MPSRNFLLFGSIGLIPKVKIACKIVLFRNDQGLNDMCSSSLNQSMWCDSPWPASLLFLL